MIPATPHPVNPHQAAWQAIDDAYVADCAALRARYPRRHRRGDPQRDAYAEEHATIVVRYEQQLADLDAEYHAQESAA